MIEVFFISLIGLMFGSFLNVVILRTPENKSVVFPASACPVCDTPLRWYHNVPLLSFIFLRAKCHNCQGPISWQYPVVELLTALIFFTVALKEEFLGQALIVGIVFGLLLALSVIDIRYRAVPDSINLAALTLAIIHEPDIIHLQNALLLAGGFAILRFYVSFFLKKEAMGEADIMIAGTLGGLLGVKMGLFAIFFSSLLALPAALIIRSRSKETPFIPFLAVAAWVAYFFEQPILTYLKLG